MYKIALCDDDSNFHSSFEQQLNELLKTKHIEYELIHYICIDKLLEDIKSLVHFDLLFLDILIDNDNGIDFAKLIRSHGMKTDIIFVTSSTEYAVDGYDTAPLHYLVKPVGYEKLEVAINRFLEKNIPAKLSLKTASGIISFTASNIMYFEIFGHDATVHIQNGSTEKILGTLKELEEKLRSYTFFRIHKSYLINLDCVIKIIRYRVTISSGEELPIGKARYNELQNSFVEYISNKTLDF